MIYNFKKNNIQFIEKIFIKQFNKHNALKLLVK